MEDKIVAVFVVTVLAAVFAGILTIAWNAISADGNVDYCYVRKLGVTSSTALYGNIDWRPDALITYSDNSETVLAEAKRLNCSIQP